MNRKFIAAAFLLLFSIAFTTAHAQDKSQSTQTGPRDLYYSYGSAGGSSNGNASSNASTNHQPTGRPGAKVRVELKRNGRVQFVSPKTTFQAGDKVRFHFSMNFNGYVVILNEGSSGKRSLLFPYEGVSNRVGMTKDFTVPQGNDWFEFDQTAGEERVTFIMSKREIQEIVQLAGGHPGMTTVNSSTDSDVASDTPATGSDTAETTAAATTAGNAPSHTASNSTTTSHTSTTSHPAATTTASSSTPATTASASPTMSEEQQILAALNARSLSSGRDLSLAVEKNEGYVLASDEALAKPVGFKLTLKHR